jgi:CRP-like cAMP-binding protein
MTGKLFFSVRNIVSTVMKRKKKAVIPLETLCDYLKHTPFDQYLTPVTLSEFASCFDEVVKSRPGKEIALDPHKVYVVCQGEVDLSTSYPEVEGKVEAKGFLCRKRRGDIINVTQTERDVKRRMTVKIGKVIDVAEDIITTGSGEADIVLVSSTMKSLNDFTAVHPELAAPIEAICISSIEDRLLTISFLKGVPRSKLNVLAAMCRYEAFDANQVVFSENSIGTKLYLVLSGTAQVVAKDKMSSSRDVESSSRPTSSYKRAIEKSIVLQRSFECGGNQKPLLSSAGEVTIAELTTGSFFGETALVFDIGRTCSVKTSEKSLFLTIDRTDFRNFLRICHTIEATLTTSIKKRMVSKLSSLGIPFLTGIPEEMLTSLATSVSIQEVPMDHVIFRQEDVGDAFYIIVHGSVRVETNHNEENNLGTLGPGQYFGEMSILFSDEHTRNATVVVSSDKTILLSIDKDSFQRIFVSSNNPVLAAEFELRVLKHSANLKHVLAHPLGVTSFRDFLEKEHAGENIDFWSGAEDFSSCTCESVRMEKAKSMWLLFCADYADRQVNLPHSMSAKLDEYINTKNQCDPDLFDAARKEIFKLMERDNFARYKNSTEFSDFMSRLGILMLRV